MPKASIDIGSNSLLLLVVGDDGAVLHDEARVVGLGRGLGDRGLFRPDRMDAAVEVLAAYAARAAELGVPPATVRVAATSAARRALNAATFVERIRKETGLLVRIIEGEEEALLTWTGALAGLTLPDGPVGVADLGGGSTEVVVGERDVLQLRTSLEIGTVRLTDQFLDGGRGRVDPRALARLKDHVNRVVQTVTWQPLPRALVCVAGTATTLMALELGLTTYDGARVHGGKLGRAALRRWIDRLLDADPDERRALVAVSPDRADTLLAGAIVLMALADHSRRETLIISDGGLRHGLLAG